MQFLTSKNKSVLLGATAFLITTFVIITAVTLDEQTEDINATQTSATKNVSNQTDYFMENFNIVSINSAGQPYRWLSGDKLSRHPDGTTRLAQPKIQIKTYASENTSSVTFSPSLKPSDQAPLKQEKNAIREHWLLLAKNGTIEKNKKVMLDGDVQVQQINSKAKTLNIQTEYLEILLDKNIASTPSDVVVRNENGTISATGMHINLKEHQLNLLANVKGYYVFK